MTSKLSGTTQSRSSVRSRVERRSGSHQGPKMRPPACRVGWKTDGRPEVTASTEECAGACLSMLRCSHRPSRDVERASQVAVSTPRKAMPWQVRSWCRRDVACCCHGLHSISPHDLSVHSATRRGPVITPAFTSLVSNESRWNQLQDAGEARGWAAQTLATSSTMVVDC